MNTFVRKCFIENWPRKLFSLLLAVFTWIIINHSSTVTKTLIGVPIKVIHIPVGKTIEGLQPDQTLNKKINLTLTGNKEVLNKLSENDLEVVLDAKDKGNDWVAKITPNNLVNLNPELKLSQRINKVFHRELIIRLSKLVTEKIPVLVTQPIGEPPKGYQFLDVWPYSLYVTVTGAESFVKQLKAKGLKLTFNLNDISENDLNLAKATSFSKEEISFFVPNAWKQILLPSLSKTPIELDDPQAQLLRIAFVQKNLLPIGTQIPVTLFFPLKYSDTLNPETFTLGTNSFIEKKNGLKLIRQELYAKGVSRLFLDTVKDFLQIVIVVAPQGEKNALSWGRQFVRASELENRYVSKVLSQFTDEETRSSHPELQEAFLRNRFRTYLNSFRLYTEDNRKLSLNVEMQANTILVSPNLPSAK